MTHVGDALLCRIRVDTRRMRKVELTTARVDGGIRRLTSVGQLPSAARRVLTRGGY